MCLSTCDRFLGFNEDWFITWGYGGYKVCFAVISYKLVYNTVDYRSGITYSR